MEIILLKMKHTYFTLFGVRHIFRLKKTRHNITEKHKSAGKTKFLKNFFILLLYIHAHVGIRFIYEIL